MMSMCYHIKLPGDEERIETNVLFTDEIRFG